MHDHLESVYGKTVTFGPVSPEIFREIWQVQGNSGCADDEGFGGGVDDVGGDDGQIVDLEDAVDLTEQVLDEPEVTTGQTGHGGNTGTELVIDGGFTAQ